MSELETLLVLLRLVIVTANTTSSKTLRSPFGLLNGRNFIDRVSNFFP